MSHIEVLLMNEIRKTLEQLQRSQVGYIDRECSGCIYYKIDDRFIAIIIREATDVSDKG